MFRYFVYILGFSMLFGANQQWLNYQGEFISSTSVIVKLDEGSAPLLGMESPLTMDMISGLHNVDRENNFDSFVPLFKNYNDFTPLHLEHKLRKSRPEVLRKVIESVKIARDLCEEVEFSAEDATRSDID